MTSSDLLRVLHPSTFPTLSWTVVYQTLSSIPHPYIYSLIHRYDLTLHLPKAWASTFPSSSMESGKSGVMVPESPLSLHPFRSQDHPITSRMSLTNILVLLRLSYL